MARTGPALGDWRQDRGGGEARAVDALGDLVRCRAPDALVDAHRWGNVAAGDAETAARVVTG